MIKQSEKERKKREEGNGCRVEEYPLTHQLETEGRNVFSKLT